MTPEPPTHDWNVKSSLRQASFNIQGNFTSPGNPSSGLNTRFQRYTRDLPDTSLVSHTGNTYHEKRQSALPWRFVREGPSVDVSNATAGSYIPDISSTTGFGPSMTHRPGTTVAISASSLSSSTVTTVASHTSLKSGPNSSSTIGQSPSQPGRPTDHVVSSEAHKLTCELCAEITSGGSALL